LTATIYVSLRSLGKPIYPGLGCARAFAQILNCFMRRGWGNGHEEGSYEKTTPIKSIHSYHNLEKLVFSKKIHFD